MADAEGRRGSRAGQGARMERAVCAGAPTWTSTSSFPEASHLPHALLLQSLPLPIPSTDSVTRTQAHACRRARCGGGVLAPFTTRAGGGGVRTLVDAVLPMSPSSSQLAAPSPTQEKQRKMMVLCTRQRRHQGQPRGTSLSCVCQWRGDVVVVRGREKNHARGPRYVLK